MLIIIVIFVFMGFFVLAHWPSEFSSTLAATSNTNWSLPQPDRSGRGSYPSTIDCKIGGAGAEVRTHAPCRGSYHEKTDRRILSYLTSRSGPMHLAGGPTTRKPIGDF
jgi:hypothetical protein